MKEEEVVGEEVWGRGEAGRVVYEHALVLAFFICWRYWGKIHEMPSSYAPLSCVAITTA